MRGLGWELGLGVPLLWGESLFHPSGQEVMRVPSKMEVRMKRPGRGAGHVRWSAGVVGRLRWGAVDQELRRDWVLEKGWLS